MYNVQILVISNTYPIKLINSVLNVILFKRCFHSNCWNIHQIYKYRCRYHFKHYFKSLKNLFDEASRVVFMSVDVNQRQNNLYHTFT